MRLLSLLLSMALLAMVSCSGPKSESENMEGNETADAMDGGANEDLVVEEDELLNDDELAAAMEEDQVIDDSGEEIAMAEQESTRPVEKVAEAADEISQAMQEPAAVAKVARRGSGGMRQYTVGQNETLMLVSFKVFGDYKRWREIAQLNSNQFGDGNYSLKEGMVLNYIAPAQEFVWNPTGEPYLIQWGDTLGLISNNVYGSMKRWKDIWDNNKPLIQDPNKIYAGFTLYYRPEGSKVAFK